MSKGRPRWGRIILALLLLSALAYGAWWLLAGRKRSSAKIPAPVAFSPDVRAPSGVRIKVEVLNATTKRGLARRAALYLRERGFDVVGMGTVREGRDSTLVLDRSGHPDWAQLVGRAMNARVESRPDSSRYLDVTVLLGWNWRPPPLPFNP